jgi:hypothetical protein
MTEGERTPNDRRRRDGKQRHTVEEPVWLCERERMDVIGVERGVEGGERSADPGDDEGKGSGRLRRRS